MAPPIPSETHHQHLVVKTTIETEKKAWRNIQVGLGPDIEAEDIISAHISTGHVSHWPYLTLVWKRLGNITQKWDSFDKCVTLSPPHRVYMMLRHF